MKQRIAIIISAIFLVSCNKGKSKLNQENITNSKTENSCKCFDGIGSSKNDEPILTYTFENNKSVSVCGFVDKEMQEQGIIISEFNIFDCETGKSFAEYGALKICKIVENKNELKILELRYLPIGKDWNWELIEIGEQTIKPIENQLKTSELKPKIQNFAIDKKQADEFLNSLKPNEGFNSDWELIIGKLEALSTIGNEKAWNILKDLENFTGQKFDGALAETWKESVESVKWIRKI
ncbi:hypothetical protein [Chryseobacterium koreense]|uniref:Lipoprotein n=1 Tax=Chryseobacterium koreense CCUG 49689 TaxID=1304281 RepID=A0A0J7LEN2_9FLAO|nr:hypothetical protein [Chryseobacterium koreense]KMQ67365.1 hypothetical protein ACM44_14795 [Chryseobacterium koreense CCUG 49689]